MYSIHYNNNNNNNKFQIESVAYYIVKNRKKDREKKS